MINENTRAKFTPPRYPNLAERVKVPLSDGLNSDHNGDTIASDESTYDTVIRRSAIGLDASRRILYVGISNNTTARALAEGMHHAGAVDVAQLDVNWSYPKFLLYKLGDNGEVVAQAPVDGFEYHLNTCANPRSEIFST
jgi:hypothetical protein